MEAGLDIVIVGLSITSSWGNGHATTYRGLVKELAALGHRVLFLEHDKPWYAANRDLPWPPYGRTELYRDRDDLENRFRGNVEDAQLVIVGSFVPEGIGVGEWVLATAKGLAAFYDIDTPATLAAVGRGTCDYLDAALIRRYGLYLSFTGGPTLRRLERELGSPCARPLYCSFDPEAYYPESVPQVWDLGYLGTYSADRMSALEALLLEPARRMPAARMAVAGPQYPADIPWPANVERIEHLPPRRHRSFYNAQAFALNLTRADMIRAGYSPSVRLFEAAACGVPILTDAWEGLGEFFEPGPEILEVHSPGEVADCLRDMPERMRLLIGKRARLRALAEHTAAHRARALIGYYRELAGWGPRSVPVAAGGRPEADAAEVP